MDKPTWDNLAKLWLSTYYKNQPAVVLFHPLNKEDKFYEKLDLLENLEIPSSVAVSSEFVVAPKPLDKAISICDNISQDLMFVMVWDGSEFVHEN